METKRDLRSKFSALRNQIKDTQERASQFSEVLRPLLQKENGAWGVYKAKSGEADPAVIVATQPQITWSYPRLVNGDIQFYAANGDDDFEVGSFGISEPMVSKTEKIDANKLAGVICPGVAFDRQGRRLGYGRGYYDRALEGFKGLKVGLCFSEQVSENDLPKESHDLDMDYLATEKELVVVNK